MMRRRVASACLAAVFSCGLPTIQTARAQGTPSPPAFPAVRSGMPLFRPAAGLTTDVTHCAEVLLLGRQDVRKELMMTGRQQAQTDDLIEKQRQDLIMKQATLYQQMREKMREGGQSFRDVGPDQRRAILEETRGQVQKQLEPFAAAQMRDLEALLTPGQVTRLHQLDLQWRGGLALADLKLASRLNLTPEQNEKTAEFLQAYRGDEAAATQAIWNPRSNPATSAGVAPPQGDVSSDLVQGDGTGSGSLQGRRAGTNVIVRQRMAPDFLLARRRAALAEVERLRKAAGARVVAIMTSAQRRQWATLLGRPFAFDAGESAPPNADN